jgi:hypothetical protein
MQEPLRELKCENDANVTGFCTMNPADAQFVSDHLRTYFLNIRRDGFCGLLQFES